MDDLGERIRRAVDQVEPIDLAQIRSGGATVRRRLPTPAVLAVIAVAAVVAVAATLVGIGVWHGHEAQSVQIVANPDATTPRSSSSTRDGITVRVVLAGNSVMEGGDVTGELSVDNRTRESIPPPGGNLCAHLAFEVLVFNLSYPADGSFLHPACLPGFAFMPGTTTETIRTPTTHFSATRFSAEATHDLPVGTYDVRLYWNHLRLPVPPDLHITIRGPSSGVFTTAALPTIAPAVIRAGGSDRHHPAQAARGDTTEGAFEGSSRNRRTPLRYRNAACRSTTRNTHEHPVSERTPRLDDPVGLTARLRCGLRRPNGGARHETGDGTEAARKRPT